MTEMCPGIPWEVLRGSGGIRGAHFGNNRCSGLYLVNL
jgi:hypothetical protein